MTEQLKMMLHDAADDHPDIVLRGDPWRRGRRNRLGRRVAGVAVTVAAAVVGTVVLTTPDLISAPEPAQEEPAEPALPDTLYEVPLNIPDISDEPLGEPAAVVYSDVVRTSLFAEEDRPVVVGAESGTVRKINDAGPRDHAVLSPDGRQLALARPPGFGVENDQPSVLVIDVAAGDSTQHELPDDGPGGGVETLTWTPDASSLVVTAMRTASVDDDGGPVTYRAVHLALNTYTGEWRESNQAFVGAFSRDSQRLVADSAEPGGSVLQDADGLDAVYTHLDRRFGVAFSPDSRMVAGISGPISDFSPPDRYELEIVDARTGDLTAQVHLGEYASAQLLEWGERGILVHSITAGEDMSSVVELIDPSDSADPERTTIIEDRSASGQIGIAAAFVDGDIREAQPPEAPFDWVGLVPDPVLLVFVAAIGLVAVMVLGSRRVRSRRGSTTDPGSTDH